MIDQKAYDRFMAKAYPEPNSGCWLWTGAVTHRGYGQFYAYGRQMGAHVFSHLWHKGKIPDGLVVHHRCNLPCCVNPEHLEAVTGQKNIQEGRKVRNAQHEILSQRKDADDLRSFSDVIRLWPTIEQFADDLSVNFWTASAWMRRDRIPSVFWMDLVEVAARRGWAIVSVQALADIAHRRRLERKAA